MLMFDSFYYYYGVVMSCLVRESLGFGERVVDEASRELNMYAWNVMLRQSNVLKLEPNQKGIQG